MNSGPIGRGNDQIDSGTLVRGRSHVSAPKGNNIGSMALYERVTITLQYMVEYLPAEVRAEARGLFNGKAVAAITAMLVVSFGAQFIPFGWVFDLAMFCLGAAALGTAVFQVTNDLRAFASEMISAQTRDGLRDAARHLARAVSVLGVGSVFLWLTKRATSIILSTSELVAIARSIRLDAGEREIALWSGENVLEKIPPKFATLERMLEETPAGSDLKRMLEALVSRDKSNWDKITRWVWFELSDRVAALAAESKKPVHYFVSEDRNFYAATRANTTVDEYIKLRSKNNRIDNEIFQKIERLNLGRVHVHELDRNGVEVRNWVQDFSRD